MEARIIAVADALHVLTSRRHGQAPRSMAEAIEEIARQAGNVFDPAVVRALRALASHRIEQVRAAADQAYEAIRVDFQLADMPEADR